jgi:hypothetical protein
MSRTTNTHEIPASTAPLRRQPVTWRVAARALFLAATVLPLPLSAAAARVHLDHLGGVTHYGTIQAAVNASADGDTISVDAGTFIEQVTVTKAITLQGAGSTTIIQAPANASLVPAAVPSLKGVAAPRYAVLDLETAVAGSGTVTVKDLTIDGNYEGFAQTVKVGTPTTYFIGIAAFNTNAIIDNVTIKGMAAGPLDGSFSENGWGIGFGIMAEGGATLPTGGNPTGGAAAPNVTVTVQNSTIDTFQKAGVIAWGPKLNAVITNNHISGSGIHGTSGQNGVQIGSVGERTNTTATVSGNTIDGLGAPDSLVSGGYTATGIMPVTAGAVEAFNNTIALDSGASANSLVGINVDYTSAAARLHDNTLHGMSVGIQVSSPLVTATHQISDNTLSTAGGRPVVFHYDPLNNGDAGGETIANFGAGYAIRVVGENFTSGTLTAGNGTGLADNSVQATITGGATTLYIDTTVANGAVTAPLTITLNGTYLLGNFVRDGEYIRFDKVAQAIAFNNPGPQNFGTKPTLTATSDSGLVVSFSSSTTDVCTITAGGVLTFATLGTCTIDANQAGNGVYGAAPTVSRSFSVEGGGSHGGGLGAADGATLLGGVGLLALLRRRKAKVR